MNRVRQIRTAWLFMAPALIVLGVFTFYPIICGVALAFCNFSLLRMNAEGALVWPRFAGLENFCRLWHDKYFWIALKNSFLYLAVVPVLQLASLMAAVVLNGESRFVKILRTAVYLPVITSSVAVGIAWKWVLRSDGLANTLLASIGMQPVPWLTDPSWAMFSVMLVTFWQGIGYYMILYLAGLQSIPDEYAEAARLDGAKPWQVFSRITLPLLKPSIALCATLSCISALKVFSEIYVMTGGGPENGTLTMVYYIYGRAFESFEMGYACSLALVLAIFVGAVSLINSRIFREGGLNSYY